MKTILSVIVLAILASSTAISLASAGIAQWNANSLQTPNQLTVAGSSTVGPIAQSELGGFPTYWNNLVAANSAWGTTGALDINKVNLATLGSGTAIPTGTGIVDTADVGEMSRPPSTGEYATVSNVQLYGVGVDSVAIVLSPDMTWFPQSLTTQQVAELFADNAPLANTVGNGTAGATTPMFTTWGQFLDHEGISESGMTSAQLNETINRAVRDPTSGTMDCFNTYFATPNGLNFIHKSGSPSTADASQNMAPYTYCVENINIFNTVSTGSLATQSDYIGFISLGYLQSYGNMLGLNIAFNMQSPPSGQTVSPLIKYYGPANTYFATTNSAYPGYNVYAYGTPVQPTQPNVIYAYSGVKGSAATGQYAAWRWLWEVTPGTIPTTGPLLTAGVWIAYMKEGNTTQSGKSDFVADNNYVELDRCDMAGGSMIDSNLQPYTPIGGQTTTIPDGKVNFRDLTYFVSAYIAYYNGSPVHTYNPYADMDANGKINFNDLKAFVSTYIAYFTTYNPQ